MPPHLSHRLQLKVLNRIYKTATWGLWKVYNDKSTGTESKKLKELAHGDEFLFSHIFWNILGQPEAWNCATEEAVGKILSFGLEGCDRNPWGKIFYFSKPYFRHAHVMEWQSHDSDHSSSSAGGFRCGSYSTRGSTGSFLLVLFPEVDPAAGHSLQGMNAKAMVF